MPVGCSVRPGSLPWPQFLRSRGTDDSDERFRGLREVISIMKKERLAGVEPAV